MNGRREDEIIVRGKKATKVDKNGTRNCTTYLRILDDIISNTLSFGMLALV